MNSACPLPRPVSDLAEMLATLEPVLHPGAYVFCAVDTLYANDWKYILASMREPEGLSVVTQEDHARLRGWPVAMRAAWLTLKVHSDLNAVGLTAAVSRVLTAQGIACNVVAGVRHDHLLVPYAEGAAALDALRRLQADAEAGQGRRRAPLGARRIIVAADIHGVTDDLRSFASALGEKVELISPWPGEGCPFPDEAAAHGAFVADGGLIAYAERLNKTIDSAPVMLVGFSAGASAGWLHATGANASTDSHAWLFYGSRIRLYADRKAACSVVAVFAEHEAAVEPRALASQIAAQNVETVIEPGSGHGFMNARSAHFDPALRARYTAQIARIAQRFLHA